MIKYKHDPKYIQSLFAVPAIPEPSQFRKRHARVKRS